MATKAKYVPPATLEDFIRRVDSLVTGALGLSIHDLPDRCYADYFEDGERPDTVALRIVRSWRNGDYDDEE